MTRVVARASGRRQIFAGTTASRRRNASSLLKSVRRNNSLRSLLHALQTRRTQNGYGNERNRFPYWQ
jgi:hypothetical protein